jgi:hypothetical protein
MVDYRTMLQQLHTKGMDALTVQPLIAVKVVMRGPDVDEETSVVSEPMKHDIHLSKILKRRSGACVTFECYHGKIILLWAGSGELPRGVNQQIRPLPRSMDTLVLLVFGLKDNFFIYCPGTTERCLKLGLECALIPSLSLKEAWIVHSLKSLNCAVKDGCKSLTSSHNDDDKRNGRCELSHIG